jgi:uncharacterized protein (TIGR03437 family)
MHKPISPLWRCAIAALSLFSLFGIASPAVGAPALSTDKTAYMVLDQITVTYSGSTGSSDYITIVPANASVDTYWEYYHTSGNPSGTATFQNALDPGSYEVRFHPLDDDKTVTARTSITVAYPNFQYSLDKAAYTWQDHITVTYSNFAGYGSDYITVVPAGSPDDTWDEYYKTQGNKNGSMTFINVIDPGVYEARYHINNNDAVVAARVRFTVAFPATTVSTDAANYAAGAAVTVTYSTAAAYSSDYVTIVPANTPDADYDEWHYTSGKSGSQKFTTNLAPGVYEARFLPNDGHLVSARSRFTVGSVAPAPWISLTPSSTLDLGSVPAAQSGAPASLTISNTGNAPLNVTGISLSGPFAALFSVVSPTASANAPLAIAANQSATVTLRFSPVTPGSQGATLAIASNDSVHPTVSISLIALATAPAPAGTNLIQNPGAESGQVASGCTAAAGAFAPWTTDGIAIVCPYPGDVTATSPGPPGTTRGNFYFEGGVGAVANVTQTIDLSASAAAIAAGATYTLAGWLGGLGGAKDTAVLVAAFRNAAGSPLGTTTIGPVSSVDRDDYTGFQYRSTTGAVPAGTTSVLLTLTFTAASSGQDDGIADNLFFTVSGGGVVSPPQIQPSVTSLDFGTVTTGQSSTRALTLSNPGSGTLRIDTLTVAPSGAFSLVSPAVSAGSPLVIPPSANVTLSFSPVTAGALNATLTIADSTNHLSTSVSLTGTGVAAGGNCDYNFPSTSEINGNAAANKLLFQLLTAPTCTWTVQSNASWITIAAPPPGTVVQGGAAVSVTVTQNPSTTAARIGQITVSWPGAQPATSATHTVTQDPSCGYTLSAGATTPPVSNAGEQRSFTVSTGPACTWTAVASPATWINITYPAGVATGPDSVRFTVLPNSTPGAPGRSGSIAVQDQTFSVTQNAGPAVGPSIFSGGVLNAASNASASPPNGGVAQGSYISIYGATLGPTPWVYAAGGANLAATLGGVSVKLTNGAAAVDVLPTFVAPSQINAIIPSNAPLGTGQLTVTFNGVASAPFPVNIVANAPGIFTLGATSTAGIIQTFAPGTPDDQRAVNGPTATAAPGDWGIAWGTGLGPNIVLGQLQPDTQPPVGGMLDLTVTVTVGGIPAVVGYKGRAPGFAGVDNIYFTIPDGVAAGCAVPVQVVAGGASANLVTIAIDPQHKPCS